MKNISMLDRRDFLKLAGAAGSFTLIKGTAGWRGDFERITSFPDSSGSTPQFKPVKVLSRASGPTTGQVFHFLYKHPRL